MTAPSSSNTPSKPKVNLPTFAEFLTSSANRRWDCVKSQVDQRQRSFKASAFYHDFSEALVRGREEGADELNLRRCISQQRDSARRANFDELTRHWLNMTQWHLPPVPVGRALWTTPSLIVNISPEIGFQDSAGNVSVVLLWLKQVPILPESVRAIHWLMQRHMQELHPRATPVVIDVRREKAHLPTRRKYRNDFEKVLLNEAQSLSTVWKQIAQSA